MCPDGAREPGFEMCWENYQEVQSVSPEGVIQRRCRLQVGYLHKVPWSQAVHTEVV